VGLSGVGVTVVTSCPPNAGPGVNADVKVSYPFTFVTPIGAIASFFGDPGPGSALTLTAEGVMPCET
jgi:hypothetical protein